LKSGIEVYHMVLKRDQDLFDFIYKRWIISTSNTHTIVLSSRGLENFEVKKGNRRVHLDLLGMKFSQTENEELPTENPHCKMFTLIKQNTNPTLSDKEKLQSKAIA